MAKKKTAVAKRKKVIDITKAVVVMSKDGKEARQVVSPLHLSAKDQGLVKLMNEKISSDPDKYAPVFIPTASSFTAAAGQCGMVTVRPDIVVANGREQPNGYQDPETGIVWCRTQCWGHAPVTAQLYCSDRTVAYDVKLYNVIDLLAKAKWNKTAFKVLPKAAGAPDEMWAPYPLDEAMTLWVDCSADEIIKWQGEMRNREKTAIRTAQTFAERNAIAAHPATPTKRKWNQDTAVWECKAWITPDGPLRIDKSMFTVDLTKALQEADPDGDVVIDVESTDITEDQGEELRAEEGADMLDPDDQREDEENDLPADEPEPEKEPEGDPQKEELVEQIIAISKHKKVSFKKLCKEMDVDPADMPKCEIPVLQQIMEKMAAA